MDVNGCKWCLIPSLRTESIPLNRRQNPHLWMSASVTDHFIGQVVMLEGIILRCSRCLNSLKPPFFAGEILQILAFNVQICIFFWIFWVNPLDFPWIFPWFKQQVIGIQAECHLSPAPSFGPSNAPGHEATEEVPRARVRAECGAEHVEDSIGLKMMGKPLEKSQNMSEMMGK